MNIFILQYVDAYPLISKSYREFAGVAKSSKNYCCGGMLAFSEGFGHKDLAELIRQPSDLQFIMSAYILKKYMYYFIKLLPFYLIVNSVEIHAVLAELFNLNAALIISKICIKETKLSNILQINGKQC